MKSQDTRTLRYELEIEIEASADRVWEALTAETNAWWLADFRMTGPGSQVRFDARAGGHLIEESPDGGSLLWYTVQACTPGQSLHLFGHLAADFGGPATTMLKLALETKGAGCVLKVSDALFGSVSEGAGSSLESGWRQLFSDGLKRHVER